jgi:surface protein
MFSGCSSLTTIYCNGDWSNSSAYCPDMFEGCTSLVGGQGTAYDSDVTDVTYARLDGGPSAPGYFSVAPQVYTEFVEATGTLTYYYDNKMNSRSGITEVYDPVGNPDASRFSSYYKKVLKAVIDPSMKNASLSSFKNMFFGGTSESWTFLSLQNMKTIEGLENLNTASVTSLNNMFCMCSSLTELDLSSWNTAKVTDMYSTFMGCSALQSLDVNSFDISNVTKLGFLFSGCSNLTTIYCDNDWSTASATSEYLFSGCNKLVGGKGTPFDSNIIDATYARPDGGTSAPGYFTMRPLVAYTVKYVDTEGNELKEARTGEGRLGTKVVMLEYDKRSILSADGESKYGYVSDNSDEVILSENEEENVITVTFRSLEAYYATLSCMANGSMERLAQYTGKFFEGEKLEIYPANGFRGSDGKFYFTSPTEDNIKIFTFPANITPVVRGGKTYYSAVILYSEDPTVAYYAEFENLALDSDDDSNSFTGLGQTEGDVYVSAQYPFYYSQGCYIFLYPASYVWTEPIAEAGTYSVSIYANNASPDDEPRPFSLGYRTADGEVFIYTELTIPELKVGIHSMVFEDVAIPAGASLVVMNEYTLNELADHYYDIELDAVKLVKTGDYRDPIAVGIEGIQDLNGQWSMANDQPIYNVAGQRLQKMQRGINIVGGRKVMVK